MPAEGSKSAPEAGAPVNSGFDKFDFNADGVKFIGDGRKLAEKLIEVRASQQICTYDLNSVELNRLYGSRFGL